MALFSDNSQLARSEKDSSKDVFTLGPRHLRLNPVDIISGRRFFHLGAVPYSLILSVMFTILAVARNRLPQTNSCDGEDEARASGSSSWFVKVEKAWFAVSIGVRRIDHARTARWFFLTRFSLHKTIYVMGDRMSPGRATRRWTVPVSLRHLSVSKTHHRHSSWLQL